ncbi:hypothetical protein ACVW01_002093 [Thermostichus sp. MS-CIW-19]
MLRLGHDDHPGHRDPGSDQDLLRRLDGGAGGVDVIHQ